MIESIIFYLTAVVLYVYFFVEFVVRNDTHYMYLLFAQTIGISLNFLEIIINESLPIVLKLSVYFLAVLLPVLIIILEKNYMKFSEIIYIVKAKIQGIRGNENSKKKIYINMVTKYQNSYYGHKLLAQLYEQEGDDTTALEEYYRALAIKKDYDMYFKVAELNKKIDYNQRAEELLRDLLRKKPEYYKASVLLGEMLFEQEKYREAINIYMDALKYNPMQYEIYYELGMTYTKINDFQKAMEFYMQASQINSLNYNINYSLGQIALIANDLLEAEKYFMEALNGYDVEAKSYYYLARIAILKGDEIRAINYINMAIEINIDIYEVVKENPIFKTICERVIIKMGEERRNNLTHMERSSQEHLEQTYELVGKLNKDNIEKNGNEIEQDINNYNKNRENKDDKDEFEISY